MRATFCESDQKPGSSVEEIPVVGRKMDMAKIVDNRLASIIDVEKGEVNQNEASALLENSMALELDDQEPTSYSKHLIVSEKVIVTLLVVCFVVVEAYFVGVSFRDWLDQQKHGNSTIVLLLNHDVELVVPQGIQVYKAGDDGGGQDEVEEDSEPYEDFEGGLSLKATRAVLHELRFQLFRGDIDFYAEKTT